LDVAFRSVCVFFGILMASGLACHINVRQTLIVKLVGSGPESAETDWAGEPFLRFPIDPVASAPSDP
ncbi:MAG: hypothetical protein U5K37_02210, partial [Natrialbaceae archaeon]|nr:hypothetical protein [Natrialbaceae archaeon]